MVPDLGDHDVDDDHILTLVTGRALGVHNTGPMTMVIGFESCLASAEYDYDRC